jgi:hypothetical protein
MNWLKKYANHILGAVASTVAVAGAVLAIPATLPVTLPAGLVAVATKIVIYGTTVGVIAAKVLPGTGKNAPEKNPNGSAVDREDPK